VQKAPRISAGLFVSLRPRIVAIRHPEVLGRGRAWKGDGLGGRSSFEARLRRAPQDEGKH
jgi:hypothetical protein